MDSGVGLFGDGDGFFDFVEGGETPEGFFESIVFHALEALVFGELLDIEDGGISGDELADGFGEDEDFLDGDTAFEACSAAVGAAFGVPEIWGCGGEGAEEF
ncbi:MAG: hypothetical protein RI897_781 [Verrucomicrobiota bacterium]